MLCNGTPDEAYANNFVLFEYSDEEEIDSKAEALRQKLQERKKQRTLQKIAEASAESVCIQY